VSQYPRLVITSVTVTNDGGRTSVLVRKGSVVDIVPGSQLEAAYGAQNLSGVLTGPQLSPEAAHHLDRSWLHN